MRPSLTRLITLRPYQSECLEAVLSSFNRIKRPAVSLPTGSGKTVLFSSLIPRVAPLNSQGNKSLVVVNRREIATQTVATLQRLHPHLRVGLDLGKERYANNKAVDVVVANINSIQGERLQEYDPSEFKMVIVDEAHHAAAASYRNVLDHFGLFEDDPSLYLVGFSATLFRRDKKDLGFDDVVYHRPAEEMVDEGHLCKALINQYDFEIPIPYDAKKGRNNFLMTAEGCALVVKVYDPAYKSTVVFSINNQHMDFLVDTFRKEGIDARGVTANMPLAARAATIEAFRSGEFPVLVNCLILTEGTDLPSIDQIILATPVGSPGLAIQMIGRGLRTHPNKPHCSVVLFKCLQKWNTEGLAPRIRGIGAEVEQNNMGVTLGSTGPQVHIQEQGSEISEVDLNQLNFDQAFQKTDQTYSFNAWLHYGKQFFLFVGGDVAYRVSYKKPNWHAAALYRSVPAPQSKSRAPFRIFPIATCETAMAARAECDHTVQVRHFTKRGIYRADAPWRDAHPTEGQVDVLKKRIPLDLVRQLNKGQASNLISLLTLGYKIDEERVKKAFKLE